MSIIYLSSEGQNPANFSNNFAQGLVLGRQTEVSVMGYSGSLRNRKQDPSLPVNEMIIVTGINDRFIVYHGDIADGTTDAEIFYQPISCVIEPGTYSPDALATAIEQALNFSEYIDQYRRGWDCTYDPATQKMTITLRSLRAAGNNTGDWCCYAGDQPGNGITPGVPANKDTLIPYAAGVKRTSFLDLETGFIGDSTEAQGALTDRGYKCEFTTIDTDYSKIQFTMGVVPEQRATRCDRDFTGESPTDETFGASRNNNLIFNLGKTINGKIDFALQSDGDGEPHGFFPYGITIGLDGRIGLVESNVGENGEPPKGSYNTTITWSAVNIGLAGPKRLAICPRDTGAGIPCYDFLADVGAGYVLVGTKTIGGFGSEKDLYRQTVKLHFGMVFDPEYINATMINAYIMSSLHTGEAPVGGNTNPPDLTTICWRPKGSNDSLATEPQIKSGLTALQETANIQDFIGFKITQTSEATMWAAVAPFGMESDESITSAIEVDLQNVPLIITSSDLNARGYIGQGAMGQGAEASILGVVRTNGNENYDEFSHTLQDNWISLNNDYPLILNRLNITLKDASNREATILAPDFNIWLKFRATTTKPCLPKHNIVVGGF